MHVSNIMFQILSFQDIQDSYLDLLGREEVPVVLERAGLDLLVVDEDLVLAVGVHDESVQMSVHVVLAADLLLRQQVLALVFEDDVHFLGAGAADVGSEHDVVGRVSVHAGLVQGAVEELDVAAAAVNILLVLNSELDNKGFVPGKRRLIRTENLN